MADFTIDVVLDDVHDRLNRLHRKQIPFATALGLTWTANDARDQVKRELPERFVLRSTWVQRGIRSSPATKRRLEARVFSRDPFMVKQERGATRRPKGQHIALPRGIRTSKKQRITRAKRPGRVLQKPNVFLADLPGSRRVGIYRRIGRRGNRRLLYVLDPRPMNVSPRFKFAETVDRAVKQRYRKNFGKALARSIATSR